MNFTDIHKILREVASLQKKSAVEIAKMRQLQREDAKKADREIAEIRQSQKKTDEQFRETDEQLKKVGRLVEDLGDRQKQTDEQFRKTDEQLKEVGRLVGELGGRQKKTDEQIAKLQESQKKTDEQFRKTDKKLKDIGRLVGDLGGTQGSVAEDLFFRNTSPLFAKLNKEFHDIRRNFTARGKSEYDIVALNNKEVLVIEVKNKLTEPDIDRFIYTQLPRFKVDFPKYLAYSLIGGVAGLSIKEPVEKYAERKGLYVLTQSGKGTAKLANSPRFKEKVFA